MMLKWRFIAALVTAVLTPIVVIVAILTAPISELHISIQNTDDYDTVHMAFYLDGSERARLYAGPGGWTTCSFHVSPGTHDVGIDFAYNYTFEVGHGGVVDYVLTSKVEFNDVAIRPLIVDKDGISYHPADFLYTRPALPLVQAISEPPVVAPAIMLAALYALLLGDIRHQLRDGVAK